jgi:diadenosine tetraphosphate (Ap4A) HIT family hydrolase
VPTAEQPKTWMPRARWNALVRGEGCPLCAECAATEPSNRHGYTVADLRLSRLRLSANQFPAGYCLLICKKHVVEPFHLSAAERTLFFDDTMLAAQALERVFSPTKMNFSLLGNAVPHLHAHITPRYYGDPCPGRPVGPGDPIVTLLPEEYEERVCLIRAALAELGALE